MAASAHCDARPLESEHPNSTCGCTLQCYASIYGLWSNCKPTNAIITGGYDFNERINRTAMRLTKFWSLSSSQLSLLIIITIQSFTLLIKVDRLLSLLTFTPVHSFKSSYKWSLIYAHRLHRPIVKVSLFTPRWHWRILSILIANLSGKSLGASILCFIWLSNSHECSELYSFYVHFVPLKRCCGLCAIRHVGDVFYDSSSIPSVSSILWFCRTGLFEFCPINVYIYRYSLGL